MKHITSMKWRISGLAPFEVVIMEKINMLTFRVPKVGIPISLEPIHSSEPGISTKVLYFTEKSVTPFLTSIPKR